MNREDRIIIDKVHARMGEISGNFLKFTSDIDLHFGAARRSHQRDAAIMSIRSNAASSCNPCHHFMRHEEGNHDAFTAGMK